jgi:hypothetical protein
MLCKGDYLFINNLTVVSLGNLCCKLSMWRFKFHYLSKACLAIANVFSLFRYVEGSLAAQKLKSYSTLRGEGKMPQNERVNSPSVVDDK